MRLNIWGFESEIRLCWNQGLLDRGEYGIKWRLISKGVQWPIRYEVTIGVIIFVKLSVDSDSEKCPANLDQHNLAIL